MAMKKDKPATKTAKASKPAAKKGATAKAAAPKKKEASKLEKMANASAGIKPAAKAEKKADVLADPEDDFEEFAPVDISSLGE